MSSTTADERCAALAAKQYGVISRTQGLALGMTSRAIDLRLASARWILLHPCTYAMAGAPRVWEQLATAAHLWAGAGAILSHMTAAAILGMSPLRPLVIDVTTARRIKTDGVRVHRTALPRSDVTRWGGFPVTTPTRTLIDLASILDEDRLEDCLENAIHNRLVRRSKLQTRITELGRRGRKGAGVLHDLVKLWDPASAPTESELETLLWRVMRKAQMPLPQSQYEVWDGARFIARLDFAYPDALLGIPADSYRWHDVRRQWEKDIEQRNCLLTMGWRLRPTTWGELKSRPERFVSDIRVLLDPGAA